LKYHFNKCGRRQYFREKPGTASIQLYSKESLELAMSLSGTKIMGNTIQVIEASLPENESKKSTLENTHKIKRLERDMKTIIVSPLSKTISAEQLTLIFSKCGLIENMQFTWIDIVRGIHTNRVEIEFKTKEALENALKMDQMLLRGYPITIKQKVKYVAFVSGIPEKIGPYLGSHFSQCGNFRIYGEKPGTASIQFYDKDSLELAISLSGTKILGNTIIDVKPEKGSNKIAPVSEEVEEIPKSTPKKKVVSKVESSDEESSVEESSEEEIPKSTSKKKAVSKVEASSDESSSEEEIPKSKSKKRPLEGAEEPKTKIQKTNKGSNQQDELKEMENELKRKELELERKELELKMKEIKIKENELRLNSKEFSNFPEETFQKFLQHFKKISKATILMRKISIGNVP
jgi:hypothetical protein